MNTQRDVQKERRIEFVELPDGLDRVFSIIKELRPHLDLAEFKSLSMLAHAADGYRVVVSEQNSEVCGVMGYRILHDLTHGSHVYVDDLVTTRSKRSNGHGAALLKFAEAEARRLGLNGLRLATGIENVEAKKFYEREGWTERAVVFKKKVPSH